MKSFGLLLNGLDVDSRELMNDSGMRLTVTNFGATITSLKMPLKNGEFVDVVLGFDNLEAYIKSFDLPSAPYFGATVGRYAGRIKNGTFCLNEKTIHLNKNNNNHSLHGGNIGFSQKIWDVKEVTTGKNPSITFSCISPAGEENYPGNLSVNLTYTLSEQNELMVEYKVTTTEDTIINLTHHSYFNLDGHSGTIVEQLLTIDSDRVLEVDNENIPTGNFLKLEDAGFDFRLSKKCPQNIDTTFVLNKSEVEKAALFSSKNNLKMTVFTNQPAVHIYVGGNCFNTIKGKENADYHALSGICFETQNFPDAPNHDHFPTAVLKKGDEYFHNTIYKFQSF
jgi:aldose 1-epimerase